MTQTGAELPTAYNDQIALLRHTEGWRRLFVYLVFLLLATPFLLGFIFLMALFPLGLAFVRIAALYTPAYHLLGRMLGVHGLPERLAKPPLWFAIYSVVYILFWLGVALICIRLLFYSGFCNQNLVCLAATRWLTGHPFFQ